MKAFAFALSTILCLVAASAFALSGVPDKATVLAQADVRVGEDGVSIRQQDRHDHRDRGGYARSDRDHDRGCHNVVTRERHDGELVVHKARHCD